VSELRVVEGVTLQGRVLLNGRDAARAILRPTTGAATLGESAVVTGQGTVRGSWTCAGTLAPGSGLDGIGLLQPSVAPFAMTPTARVAIDAGGTADDEYDRIDGNSGAIITLDGTLDVNFVDGYVPEPRDQFEIITASMIDGSFASTTIEPVGAIGPAHVVYTGDSVIVVICAADRDADGELTIFDFLAFQNLFDSGDLRADLDQDGQLTIFDFLTYQNRFDAGCG
ncbi:MAG: GC-type dockerin domain-anchored protein, partial [Phycisphaerales bacterium JB060]